MIENGATYAIDINPYIIALYDSDMDANPICRAMRYAIENNPDFQEYLNSDIYDYVNGGISLVNAGGLTMMLDDNDPFTRNYTRDFLHAFYGLRRCGKRPVDWDYFAPFVFQVKVFTTPIST